MAVSRKMILHFRCEGLADMDTFSKSDPYLVLYTKQPDGRLFEAGRTETIMNNLNPQFQKTIMVQYVFETKQPFLARMIDYDGGKKDDENDPLGNVEFDLAHIASSRGQTKTFDVLPRGKLIVTAVEAAINTADTIQLEFYGHNMKKMDTFGKSDPYLKIFRLLADGSRKLIYQTEVQKVTLDPVWKPFPPIPTCNLMGKSQDEQSIIVECWDEDFFSDDAMGFFQCSVLELLQAKAETKAFILRKTEKPGKMYGEVYVKVASIRHYPTFLEMLKSGLQINMAVSVDFTGSNGDPRLPASLHFMGNPTLPNQYVRAISDVGRILIEYDSDKQVAGFGFGAVLPRMMDVSHFFHLNMTPDPYVAGIDGLIAAYSTSVSCVKLSGPTNFAPTILAVTSGARQAAGVYTVLLIITDGEITDMDDTINAIVAADDAPLSIVIVGVGNGSDFQAMNQLDGDNQALRNSRTGKVSRRDLVQFVPMRSISSAGQLAAEVLKEVPEQVEKWAAITGFGAVKT